jgi:hypothetical protein
MSIACWIPKATNTHSEYVIFIAFSTAAMVARMRICVTLNTFGLSYYKYLRTEYLWIFECNGKWFAVGLFFAERFTFGGFAYLFALNVICLNILQTRH